MIIRPSAWPITTHSGIYRTNPSLPFQHSPGKIIYPCLASTCHCLTLFCCPTLLPKPFHSTHFPRLTQFSALLSQTAGMGTYVDSEGAFSPPRLPTMIRRERREAKRRMVFFSLLACVLFLTIVAFRQPDSFMSEYTQHRANSTATTNAKAKSWFAGRPISMGPILSDPQRHLSDSSLEDLKNTSLGVRDIGMV